MVYRKVLIVDDDEELLRLLEKRFQQEGYKVASAIHLRFDIQKSSLPDEVKQKLLSRTDQRITSDGLVVIKAQQSRSQLQNRQQAVQQLQQLIQSVLVKRRPRKKTRPGTAAIAKRINRKKLRGQVKALRQKVEH